LERQLEPKPEENEGHFSRARISNESVFPVRIEFYWVLSQLPLCSPYNQPLFQQDAHRIIRRRAKAAGVERELAIIPSARPASPPI